MRRHVLFCGLLFIMLTNSIVVNAKNIITITPMDRIVSNIAPNDTKSLENDVYKNISIVENELFGIYVDIGASDRYIKVTSSSSNIDFVRFRKDKNNGYITFQALNPGSGKLLFQVDTEDSVIKKYIYTIKITNNITNTTVYPDDEDTKKPITKYTNENTTEKSKSTDTKPKEIKRSVSANTRQTKKAITQNITTNNSSSVPVRPNMPTPPKMPTPPSFASSSIIEDAIPNYENMTGSIVYAQAATGNNDDAMLYRMAEDFRDTKSYDNAIKTYGDIISKYPDSTNSLNSKIRLAEIYTIKKDYDNAYSTFKLVYEDKISKETQKAYSLYAMGIARKIQRNYEDAKNNFIEVINRFPDSSYRYDAAYDYAHTLSLENRISDGFNILEKAIAENKPFEKKEKALILLGEMYENGNRQIRDYQKAYDTYSLFLMYYPDSKFAPDINNRREFISRNYLNLR